MTEEEYINKAFLYIDSEMKRLKADTGSQEEHKKQYIKMYASVCNSLHDAIESYSAEEKINELSARKEVLANYIASIETEKYYYMEECKYIQLPED